MELPKIIAADGPLTGGRVRIACAVCGRLLFRVLAAVLALPDPTLTSY